MARSRSGIVRILLFAGLIVVALISYNRLRPRESESNPPTQRPPANDQAHRSEEGSLGRHPRHERPDGYREQPPASCETLGTSCVSLYFNSWQEPERGSCSTKISHGYPIPDFHRVPLYRSLGSTLRDCPAARCESRFEHPPYRYPFRRPWSPP